MRVLSLLVIVLLASSMLAAVPGVSAYSTCKSEQTAGAGGVYVVADGIRSDVWAESNDLDGLQTSSCTSGEKTWPADMVISEGVPQDLGILGVCTVGFGVAQCW